MSPRAACRLAALGFTDAYDYTPSKVDWMARGLPLEGEKAGEPRAIDIARTDVVTCELQDTIGAVHDRVTHSPYGFAFVLGPGGVLLGRLRKASLEHDPSTKAQDVMEPGPSTTRPDTPPDKLLAKLQHAGLTTAVLTDPEGRLLGIVRRGDLEGAVQAEDKTACIGGGLLHSTHEPSEVTPGLDVAGRGHQRPPATPESGSADGSSSRQQTAADAPRPRQTTPAKH